MRIWFFPFIVVLGFYLYERLSIPNQVPPLNLKSSKYNLAAVESSEVCRAKKQCVLVYLTPWCPTCRGTVSLVNQMMEYWKNSSSIGLMAIVGGDNENQLLEMASNIKNYAFLDTDNSFGNSANIQSVPTWFVINEDRKILKRQSGGYPELEKMNALLNLEKR